MCFELAKLVDEKWLASITEVEDERAEWEASAPERAEPAPPPTFKYNFPDHIEFKPTAQARADVFVLTVETELYAVMYDKRKLIDQHALSQI